MTETATEFFHCIVLGTISVQTEVRYFGQSVLASIACVRYLHSVSLLHEKQPHHCLLNVHMYLPIVVNPTRSGFPNLQSKTLLHADAIVTDSRYTSMFPICKNSRLNTCHTCFKTVTSFGQYDYNTRVLLKGLNFLLPYHAINSFLSPSAQLVHAVKRYVGGCYCVV